VWYDFVATNTSRPDAGGLVAFHVSVFESSGRALRPTSVESPAGWHATLGSCEASDDSFCVHWRHNLGVPPGQSLSGFRVLLHAPPTGPAGFTWGVSISRCDALIGGVAGGVP
jgi:hypothetical protein